MTGRRWRLARIEGLLTQRQQVSEAEKIREREKVARAIVLPRLSEIRERGPSPKPEGYVGPTEPLSPVRKQLQRRFDEIRARHQAYTNLREVCDERSAP